MFICKIFSFFLRPEIHFFWHLFGGNIAQHLSPRTDFSSGCPFSMASSQVALCDIILRKGLLTLLLAHVLHSLDIFQCCVTQVFLSKWFFLPHIFVNIFWITPIFVFKYLQMFGANGFFSGTSACGSSLAKQKLLWVFPVYTTHLYTPTCF